MLPKAWSRRNGRLKEGAELYKVRKGSRSSGQSRRGGMQLLGKQRELESV